MTDPRHEAEVGQQVAFYLGLPTEREFRDHVAATFADREPDDVAVQALRSPQMVPRTLDALDAIIDGINRELKEDARLPRGRQQPARWGAWMRRRRDLYGGERRGAAAVLRRLEEEGAQTPRSRRENPRRRAEHRVGQLLSQPGMVLTHDDWARIVAEEKTKDKVAAAARKEEGRRQRRDIRAKARGDSSTRNARNPRPVR